MNFDTFIQTAWNDHGDRPEEVADRLAGSLDLLQSPANIPPFARLVTHVYGEHLARWNEGIALLEALRRCQAWDGGSDTSGAVDRGVALLRYAGDPDGTLPELPTEDRIAVLATASSAFAGQGNFKRAIAAYDEAVKLATPDLPAGSSAVRSLAVGGNNLAAALEEKTDRDEIETKGMVAAAEGGLTYWRLAGTWLEEERAEYRLSRSLMQAGDPARALTHAERCAEICDANNAPSFEKFFASALLSIARRGNGDAHGADEARADALHHYALIPEDDRRWCESDLAELGA